MPRTSRDRTTIGSANTGASMVTFGPSISIEPPRPPRYRWSWIVGMSATPAAETTGSGGSDDGSGADHPVKLGVTTGVVGAVVVGAAVVDGLGGYGGMLWANEKKSSGS